MTDTETMRHLGNVLTILAELHPDDRSTAFENALAYHNENSTVGQVEGVEGYSTRLLHTGPLDIALGRDPNSLVPHGTFDRETAERCAALAEGPIYKTSYRGHEGHNWSADGSSDYGRGRLDAAAQIRKTLASES